MGSGGSTLLPRHTPLASSLLPSTIASARVAAAVAIQQDDGLLGLSPGDKARWLDAWPQSDCQYMSVLEFLAVCGLQDTVTNRRLFDLVDVNFTGKVPENVCRFTLDSR